MGNNEVEMTNKPSSAEVDTSAAQQDSSVEDRPPTPPKRDFKAEEEDSSKVADSEQEKKRGKIGSFPRPEVIYKPENTESLMTCMKNILIIINLIIWLFGATLTGLGIWIKVDKEFWNIQTVLDMTQFSTSANILIAAGVIIMIIGFIGCYGAFALSLWMLVVYAVVCILIVILEIAVMALVWTAISNKDVKEEIKAKARKAMQDMSKDDTQRYFLDLLQVKLQCCGIDGPDDYNRDETEGIPQSCTGPEGYPHQQGCSEAVIKYFKSYAGILGGVVVAVFILQLAALVLTVCLACSVKNSAANSIF